MSNMSNSKTYTEVVLEFIGMLDVVEQRIITRQGDDHTRVLDALASIAEQNSDFKASLASGEAKFKAIDKRLDTNETGITRVRNINAFIALLGSTIAGIIGTQK